MKNQRLLLNVADLRVLGWPVRPVLRRLAWTVESGAAQGLRLQLPQNRDFIWGTSETPVQVAIARHLEPGGVFYDVGANVGFFSLLAARITGPSGSVIAIEPLRENAAAIRANAALNGFAHVQVLEVAASAASGKQELLTTEWDGGASLAASVVKPDQPVSTRIVDVVSIDDLIVARGLRQPSFVKIDVEGVELDVISGLTQTIRDATPVLLCEIDDGDADSFKRRWDQVDKQLAAFGYEIVRLPPSYPNLKWHVGHTLALPRRSNGSGR